MEMKTYALIEGLKQEYDKYTVEDRKVWSILFNRQIKQLLEVAHPDYLAGIEMIGFRADEIPDFRKINQRLAELTGWEIVVVPGIIDQFNFFKMLANKQFPSSTWLRSMEELDYLSEPDMFHDAFGHMPLLTNPVFCDFFHQIGVIGSRYLDHPSIVEMIGRVYWFTIEFGLIRGGDDLKIYGAGILSSIGETKYSLSDAPERLPFDIVEIMHTDFDNTKIQVKYFVIESFEQLMRSAPIMETEIERLLAIRGGLLAPK
jgi:phenylalanine-4-hydroxylase